jgi:DNA polymerase I-like protein with 3'-5' exonuclease and polymerase domains
MPPVPDTGWTPPEGFPSLCQSKLIAIDVETYDPDLREKGPGVRRDGYICGVSVATDDGFKGYYPIRHKDHPDNFAPHKVMGWLKEELSRESQGKVGANMLYDLDYLAEEGVEVKGPLYDIQIAEPLIDETQFGFSLDDQAKKYLGRGKHQSQLMEWGGKVWGNTEHAVKSNIWRSPVALVGPYAEGDAADPLEIFAKQRAVMEGQRGLWELFDGVERRLIPMLLAMRRRGVRVDLDRADQVRRDLKNKIVEIGAGLKRLVGFEVNVWEADSIARACDAEGIPYPRSVKKGLPSFTKPWMKNHASPLIRMVMEGRQAEKILGTFIEGYIFGYSVKGRIHTEFHQLHFRSFLQLEPEPTEHPGA